VVERWLKLDSVHYCEPLVYTWIPHKETNHLLAQLQFSNVPAECSLVYLLASHGSSITAVTEATVYYTHLRNCDIYASFAQGKMGKCCSSLCPHVSSPKLMNRFRLNLISRESLNICWIGLYALSDYTYFLNNCLDPNKQSTRMFPRELHRTSIWTIFCMLLIKFKGISFRSYTAVT
jgi:hypothetical protein